MAVRKIMILFGGLFFALVGITRCTWATPPGAEPVVLGVGDTIEVDVVGVAQLHTIVTIPEQGRFAFAPIGIVAAAGRTAKEIAGEIKTRLADGYVKDPKVNVIVVDTASKNVLVIGAVRKPVPVVAKFGISLLEVLSHANGLRDDSTKEAIVIRGRSTGEAGKVTRVALSGLLKGEVEDNLTLYDGDTVIFPSKGAIAEQVNVLGAVRQPGKYPLLKGKTLVDFIAEAGGPSDAAGNVVAIIPSSKYRTESPNAPQAIEYDLNKLLAGEHGADAELVDGDTIMLQSAVDIQMKVFVIGQVNSPGMYPWQEGITVLNAISLAGGMTPKAATKGIRVIKEGGAGKRPSVEVDTGYRLERGDTVIVPEGWF